MKKITAVIMVMSFLFAGLAVAAGSKGTPAEAEAMVKKAINYIKENGKAKAFAEFSNPKGKFVDRDLYITVYDMTGKCLAHGANQKMIGKDMIELRDLDGKPYVKERQDMAKEKGKGWIQYKFTNPVTKMIEDKTSYFEKYDDVIITCGAYKK